MKRKLYALLVFSLGLSIVVISLNLHQRPNITRYCFDLENLGIRVTESENCNPSLLDLGSAEVAPIRGGDGKVNRLNPFLKNRFTAIQRIAKREGISLRITSGYRSYAKQESIFQREVALKGSETLAAHWVLPPRLSRHVLGIAIDIASGNGDRDMVWLSSHAASVGLCQTYANERWHYEGVIAPGETCPAMAASALSALR